ncbi:MAG: sodium/proline symporter PutP [Alteromonadaceae bacterium]|nr:MAG: sodium/proline symporter PutP [Alteromonadaceae bacterium]
MTSVAFAIYLLIVGLISWWAFRLTSGSEDYFLGGRTLSPGTAALSAGASDMSGWLLLGLPGYAFASGLESLWLSGGLCLGLACCWLSMARRLRLYSELLGNALTIPSYLQRRFNDSSASLRLITAFFILLFFLFYVSSGFVAGGKLFATVFALDYRIGISLSFIFVVLYTLIGGFLAVSWTDVLQGLLMLLALLVAPIMVMANSGGALASWQQIAQLNPHLLNPFTNASGEALGLLSILSLCAWGLGYFGQPHILARFMAIKHPSEVGKASGIAIVWSVIVNICAISVGLLAVVLLSSEGITLADKEQVFMVLANTVFHPVIASILMAAILAAIMSTADSQLLVCSSAIAEDLLGFWNKKLASTRPLCLGRFGVLSIGALAWFIARDPESQVLDIVSYAWAGLGAAFGPVILFSLYLQNMSRLSAFIGIASGGISVIIWQQLSGGLFDVYELLPGALISSAAILITNKLVKLDDALVVKQFDTFNNLLKKT